MTSSSPRKAGEEGPCRACGMKLRFEVSPRGSLLPLQRVTTVYKIGGDDTVSVALVGSEIYVSHFETCPKASTFSRRKA